MASCEMKVLQSFLKSADMFSLIVLDLRDWVHSLFGQYTIEVLNTNTSELVPEIERLVELHNHLTSTL